MYFVYRFRLHYITSTTFEYIRNMDRQRSRPMDDQRPSALLFTPITNQQTSLHILVFPKELFIRIALFMNTEPQLTLAHICRTIYGYHKEQCREEKAAFLYSSLTNVNHKYEYCKILKCWLSETGWAAVKVIFETIETNPQNNNSYPIRALFLYESF
jgi:hypothetical protein